MDKHTLSAEPYLALADYCGVERTEFLHRYLPHLVTAASPGVLFTALGDSELEIQAGVQFPDVTAIAAQVEPVKAMLARDLGVFERTYEDGVLVRETYYYPPMRSEAAALAARISSSFDMSSAVSIGARAASGPYAEDYITVYVSADYQNRGAASYGAKFSAATGELLDVKLLFTTVPAAFQQHVPTNATQTLFGVFLENTQRVDVYFAFAAEPAYADYFGERYTAPPASTLGLGMVGVTVDTRDNTVCRVKRYVF